MAKQCCKTCKYLEVPLTDSGKRIVRQYYSYPCSAPLPAAADARVIRH